MPTEEEEEIRTAVSVFAHYLGIDLDKETELMYIAEEAFVNLPDGWEFGIGEGDNRGIPYFYNKANDESVWNHPEEEKYKRRVEARRKGLQEIRNKRNGTSNSSVLPSRSSRDRKLSHVFTINNDSTEKTFYAEDFDDKGYDWVQKTSVKFGVSGDNSIDDPRDETKPQFDANKSRDRPAIDSTDNAKEGPLMAQSPPQDVCDTASIVDMEGHYKQQIQRLLDDKKSLTNSLNILKKEHSEQITRQDMLKLSYKKDLFKEAQRRKDVENTLNNLTEQYSQLLKDAAESEAYLARLLGKKVALDELNSIEECEELEKLLKTSLEAVEQRKALIFKDKIGSQEQRLCVICQENEKSVVLIPCRHMCLCEGCSNHKQLKQCPLCRKTIESKISVYS